MSTCSTSEEYNKELLRTQKILKINEKIKRIIQNQYLKNEFSTIG